MSIQIHTRIDSGFISELTARMPYQSVHQACAIAVARYAELTVQAEQDMPELSQEEALYLCKRLGKRSQELTNAVVPDMAMAFILADYVRKGGDTDIADSLSSKIEQCSYLQCLILLDRVSIFHNTDGADHDRLIQSKLITRKDGNQ